MKSKRSKAVIPAKRSEALTALRNLKMARSAHAYVRGNTRKFYEWLDSPGSAVVPKGPAVWICGDCHIGNLGPIANARGWIEVQIRDLDQTVIGNPAHDLIRLGLSLASAARGSDLPGITTASMIEQMVEGYEEAFAPEKPEAQERPASVKLAVRSALRRKWRDLARERIGHTKPAIPLGARFWPLSKGEREEIDILFAEEKVRRMATVVRSREDGAAVKVLDAAFWRKGCSSLGNLRYAVLLQIGGRRGELCLIDVKEAIAAIAPRYGRAKMPRDNAERVVTGGGHLSPALGQRMLAARLGERAVFLRELMPQDLQLGIEHLTLEEANSVARYLATVVGRAHSRQMKPAQRAAWLKQLTAQRSTTLDAPSWLWSSVVDLMMSHEGAYLDHCRKHALIGQAAGK